MTNMNESFFHVQFFNFTKTFQKNKIIQEPHTEYEFCTQLHSEFSW